MSNPQLERVIAGGAQEKELAAFFSQFDCFRGETQKLTGFDDGRFSAFTILGSLNFGPVEQLLIVSARVEGPLSERSGKKAQYEAAKKILKTQLRYEAGIFIFRGDKGQFRFSLVYTQPQGKKIDFSNFRRFTYFVSQEMTNNTFRARIGVKCSFASLDGVKDAFSVEAVNKEFYKEIAQFYYMLTGKDGKDRQLVLPSVADDDKTKYEEFAVRLIGRIIFCWFLKHKTSPAGKALIPANLLSSPAVKADYYHSTLERLFFELMNTPGKDRKPETALLVPNHNEVPFLNGGLFEEHPNDGYDGCPNYALKIPDGWFKAFFELLERYNFTIDENSIVDAEVSVDPEMMGRIFENLLAEVNPETGETARKATGSYYTPRVIVDYMVEQSLKQYLLTKTGLDEERVITLLDYEKDIEGWQDVDKEAVVRALNEIKTIDPACGSGAFPMGVLHRMILVLQKVDPDLKLWRALYLDSYHPVLRSIIEEKLRKGNEQYIRKLTIIQDSIYGVDIQPVAVEIAKLRCFLSLVVDEMVIDQEENRGIEPLPNLEFKFVAANSLIGIPGKEVAQGNIVLSPIIQKLKTLRENYLRSYGDDKKRVEREFRETQALLVEHSREWGVNSLAQKLIEWEPFSYKSNSWFAPEWMFGVSGFDVVIANPPYGAGLEALETQYLEAKYSKYKSNIKNSAIYFTYRAIDIVNPLGVHTFIVPKSLCYSRGWNKCASVVSKGLVKLIDVGKAFEDVKLEQVIFIRKQSLTEFKYTNGIYDGNSINELCVVPLKIFTDFGVLLTGHTASEMNLIMKLTSTLTSRWGDYVRIERGVNWQSQVSNKLGKTPVHRGAQLSPYHLDKATDFIDITKFKVGEYSYLLKPKILNQLALAHVINPYPHFFLQAALGNSNLFVFETISCTFSKHNALDLKFLLAINNSKLFAWLLYKFVYSNAIRSTRYDAQYVAKVPCPNLHEAVQVPYVRIVDKIHSITSSEDYLTNKPKQAQVKTLEHEIDQLVYQLYDLTPEEIAIVEGKQKAS